jgi:hypothetical protein
MRIACVPSTRSILLLCCGLRLCRIAIPAIVSAAPLAAILVAPAVISIRSRKRRAMNCTLRVVHLTLNWIGLPWR